MHVKLIKHGCANKMMIKIKNKKAFTALEVVVAAAVLLGLLAVFFYGVIPILTDKQLPFVRGLNEKVTQDCDEDGVIGVTDTCQCISSVKSKEDLGGGKTCGPPNQVAVTNCPNLCKPTTVAAK